MGMGAGAGGGDGEAVKDVGDDVVEAEGDVGRRAGEGDRAATVVGGGEEAGEMQDGVCGWADGAADIDAVAVEGVEVVAAVSSESRDEGGEGMFLPSIELVFDVVVPVSVDCGIVCTGVGTGIVDSGAIRACGGGIAWEVVCRVPTPSFSSVLLLDVTGLGG
jgi:hypothetical protein